MRTVGNLFLPASLFTIKNLLLPYVFDAGPVNLVCFSILKVPKQARRQKVSTEPYSPKNGHFWLVSAISSGGLLRVVQAKMDTKGGAGS